MDDPFLDLADRQMSSPVKARLRAAEARQSLREQQRDDKQRELSASYRVQRQHELDDALARADGGKLQTLIAQLDTLTLEEIPQLAAFVRANGWHSAAVNTLFLARRLASESIIRAREERGLPPFDDPLPGDPATPEQGLHAAFAGSSECSSLERRHQMEIQTSNRSNTLPAQSSERDIFTMYGESAGGGYVTGELLKFAKGDWLAGQQGRAIPEGTKFIAVMDSLIVGWQRWENQRPVAYRMGLLVEGFVPPSREELGDKAEDLWERDDRDEARDPWQLTNYLQLVDPNNTEQVLTFTTSSKGGLSTVARLCRDFGRAREKEPRDNQYPVVMLSSGSYAHRDRALGRIKFPVFAIVGWVNKDDFSPIVDPIDDEVPY